MARGSARVFNWKRSVLLLIVDTGSRFENQRGVALIVKPGLVSRPSPWEKSLHK